MTDITPNVDAGALRGVIGAAAFHVTMTQNAIVEHVAAGETDFSDEQRAAARKLVELSSEASRLTGLQLRSTDAQLLERRVELKMRADDVVERADELGMLFPDLEHRDDNESDKPVSALDGALDALVDAVLAVAEELTTDEPLDPDDLLWAAQRLAHALEEAEGLYTELGDRAASWRDAARDFGVFGPTPAGEHAYRAHLQAAPERLYAAARALQLAARHGNLVELEAFRRPPQTRVRIADASIDIVLLDETRRTYRVRVAGAPAGDPTTPGASDGELVDAIASAAGLELADVEQRRLARDGARHARRTLDAITAFRNSAQRGDPEDAARLAAVSARANSAVVMPYAHRSDSTPDLVDVLLDLQAERWPVATVLMDSLAAACRVLDDHAQTGIDRLLSHPNEDQAAAEHVRGLVEAWTAAALEHEAKRLRDPAALRYALLTAVLSLRDQGRPANAANLHATATKQLVSRDDVDQTIIALEGDRLLEREDPLAARPVWQLTAEGRALVDAP